MTGNFIVDSWSRWSPESRASYLDVTIVFLQQPYAYGGGVAIIDVIVDEVGRTWRTIRMGQNDCRRCRSG